MRIGIPSVLLADTMETAYPIAQQLNQIKYRSPSNWKGDEATNFICFRRLQLWLTEIFPQRLFCLKTGTKGVIGRIAGTFKEQFHRLTVCLLQMKMVFILKAQHVPLMGCIFETTIEQVADNILSWWKVILVDMQQQRA